LERSLFLPALVAAFVEESGAIAAANVGCNEPLKTFVAVRRRMLSDFFIDPGRIEPEMCHDLHLKARLNKNSNNAARIVLEA
jgi:hypothetical protein